MAPQVAEGQKSKGGRPRARSFSEIQKNNPYRQPQWRYERAVEIHETGAQRYSYLRDDKCTRKLVKFIQAWDRANRYAAEADVRAAKRQLMTRYEGLYYAYEIFMRPDEDTVKYRAEARILSGQSDEEISEACGVIPETVFWYEKAFYNVRDRLRFRDYISGQVIGQTVGIGLQNLTQALTAKFFGYFAGPTVLELVLDGYDHGLAPPSNGQDFAPYLDKLVGLGTRLRAATSVNAMEVNRFNVMQLLDVNAKLLAEANRMKQETGAKSAIEENIQIMLSNIDWTVGRGREDKISNSGLVEYMGHTAEPRANDILRLAAGEDVESVADIAERKMPPPRTTDEDTE